MVRPLNNPFNPKLKEMIPFDPNSLQVGGEKPPTVDAKPWRKAPTRYKTPGILGRRPGNFLTRHPPLPGGSHDRQADHESD